MQRRQVGRSAGPEDTGVTLWFNGEYGVVATETANVFIHRNQAVRPYCNGDEVPAYGAEGRHPDTQSVIRVLSMVESKKGPRAEAWCYEENYQRAIADIENRPTYRFMERLGDLPRGRLYNPRQYRYRQIWCGKNLQQARHHDPVDGTTLKRYYEKWDGEKWTEVADPRIK